MTDTPFSAKDASLILEAHDIDALILNAEEWDLLEANNPELAEAYLHLRNHAELPK